MPITAILLATFVAALWGYNFVVIHYGLGEFSPLLFGSLRFVFAALPAVFLVGRPSSAWRGILGYGLYMTLEFGVLFFAMYLGFPPGLGSVVLQAQAFFTLLFSAWILKDRPTAAQWAGVMVAFLGILILSGQTHLQGGWVPFAMFLFCALLWGASNIYVKMVAPKNALNYVVWSSVVPPIPLFLVAVMADGPTSVYQSLVHIRPMGWFSLIYIGWVSTAFGFGVWTSLLKKYSANAVAPFTLLVPFFGVTASHLLLNEQFTRNQLVGSSLLILGLVFTNLRRRNSPVIANTGEASLGLGLPRTPARPRNDK